MIVLDTSALLFWTLDPSALSAQAQQAIEQADKILVSSISIWEIGLKVKRGKLKIPITIDDYIERLNRVEKLDIISVDVQTWLANLELDWDHRDPADRTIVALAAQKECPLVTSDGVIANFYPRTIT